MTVADELRESYHTGVEAGIQVERERILKLIDEKMKEIQNDSFSGYANVLLVLEELKEELEK